MPRPLRILACGCIATLGLATAQAAASPARNEPARHAHRQPKTTSATAHSHGMTLTLTATPARPRPGAPVEVSLQAHAISGNGAFGDRVEFGDGTSTPPVALPQYCLAHASPASRAWHFSHRYRKAGTYKISASVYVNCTGEHATVTVRVHVT